MIEEPIPYSEQEINEYVAYATEYLQDLKILITKLDKEISDPSIYRRWCAVWIIRSLGLAAEKSISEIYHKDILL